MKITDEKLMDIRLIRRNLGTGELTREALESHLAGLPDITESAAPLEIEVADVGVDHVQAKETGEEE